MNTQATSLQATSRQATSLGETWSTERVEQLRSFVTAGLTCSQIAAEIGVTRNAVIGKVHRLGLQTSGGRPGRRPSNLTQRMRQGPSDRPGETREPRTRIARMLRAATAGQTVVPFPSPSAIDRRRSRACCVARCSSLPAAVAAGRSAIRARPTSASAATTRSLDFRIARAMRVLPTGCPPGGARRARGEGLGGGGLSFGSSPSIRHAGLAPLNPSNLACSCGANP